MASLSVEEYVKPAAAAGRQCLKGLLLLLENQVCPRCALRVLGIRAPAYSPTPPSAPSIVANLRTQNLEAPAKSPLSQPDRTLSEEPNGSGSPVEGNCRDPESQTCVACLGVLHTFDGGGMAELGKEPGSPEGVLNGHLKAWSKVLASIKAGLQNEGHEFDGFCMEVSLPASLLVRQYAARYFLCQALGQSPVKSFPDVVTIKEALKWSLSAPLEQATAALIDPAAGVRCSLAWKHAESAKELEPFADLLQVPNKKRPRRQWQRPGKAENGSGSSVEEESGTAVQKALQGLAMADFLHRYPWPPLKIAEPCQVHVSVRRLPVFVGGHYLKLARGISQSPWLIDEERHGDGSVQECIADIVIPYFKADDYKFMSAGREDIDVRMLGGGRPFILEVMNARHLPTPQEYAQMEALINSSKEGWVEVRKLQGVGKEVQELLKAGEADKQKQYTALVWCERPVTKEDMEKLGALKDLVLQQKTPVRVLHRRSPLVRERTIHSMRCEPVLGHPHYMLMHLETQAGTYVKEFVHGDLGRTVPNVGSLLGCEADILQLDVTGIKMDFL